MQDVRLVESVERFTQGLRLEIDLGETNDLVAGASVAVNGCCLTVVEIADSCVRFEVISETLNQTNLGSCQSKTRVNVERSLRLNDELGGHILAGHISGCVPITTCDYEGQSPYVEFQAPENLRRYFFEKGFTALNGVSLTLARYDRQRGIGRVNLIPETLNRTNFRSFTVGDRLNLEIDSMTRTIVDSVRDLIRDEQSIQSLLKERDH